MESQRTPPPSPPIARPRGVSSARSAALALALAAVALLSLTPLRASEEPATHAVSVVGVEPALAEQLAEYLGQPNGDSPSALRHWQRAAEGRLPQSLAALGYNDSRIRSRLEDGALVVEVELGPPTTYTAVDARVLGNGADEELLTRFIDEAAPRVGAQLVHADYEKFKADLLSIALSLGYFDAEYSRKRLAVSRRARSATLELALASGPRYRYGPVSFSTEQLSPEFLQQWVTFQRGEPYNAQDVDAFARGLRDSGYFGGVRVRPEIDSAVDGEVPIHVEGTLREPHSATVGIGYGTDSGVRLRGSLTRHYVNRHGHSAGVETELSAENQELSAYYRLPHKPDPANHYLQFDVGAARTAIDDGRSQRYSIGANHNRITAARWLESYSLKFQQETSEIEGEDKRSELLIPGASWSRERNTTFAGRALRTSVDLQLSAARRALLSDIDFDRFHLKLGGGYALSNRHLLHTRLDLGWVEANDFQQLPLSLRFYAGGDDSIRGYARREVSPRDADGNAIGGRYLSTFSAEYEYRLRESLGLAAFVDMGRAGYNDIDPVAYGGGFGLRWYSPVGPIKVYLAVPLRGDDKSPRFHLTVGG